MLKNELEAENARLTALVRTAGERLETEEQKTLAAEERIQAIKHIVRDREARIAKLEGYLDRVREEEAVRLAPKSEFEAWQRDKAGGQALVASHYDSNPWRDDRPKDWLDL